MNITYKQHVINELISVLDCYPYMDSKNISSIIYSYINPVNFTSIVLKTEIDDTGYPLCSRKINIYRDNSFYKSCRYVSQIYFSPYDKVTHYVYLNFLNSEFDIQVGYNIRNIKTSWIRIKMYESTFVNEVYPYDNKLFKIKTN
jgi:hypothetical protein